MVLDWVLLGLRLLAAIILYTFLGVAFYTIWRELKQAEARRFVQLRVVDAAGDQVLAVGDTLSLQPVTLLGRNPDNTIILNDASASGRHARIRQENGIWWLEDLGSRNGTLLNELPLSKPISLTDGDVIGIGNVRLRLELE